MGFLKLFSPSSIGSSDCTKKSAHISTNQHIPMKDYTVSHACCSAISVTNPPRVPPPTGTDGASLDQCSILRRFSRGVCPAAAELVCSRAPGTTVSQVVIQLLSGSSVVASRAGSNVAAITIVCTSSGWKWSDSSRNLHSFTGVSCSQGTLTSGDYALYS
ncbi:unnamed protein product [Toxocara canis]|uniref:C6 domain-containing protein n=1 Tax=Toxocara canis TaxID=6265 RepID=A0A183UW14_TOXCA|nr:unnamed protein product [Toxocara canis]